MVWGWGKGDLRFCEHRAKSVVGPVREGEMSRPGSDMPNIPMSPKRKSVGYHPSCFPGLISMAYIHPPGTQPAFPPWQKQDSLAKVCSLKVVPVGLRFRLCGGKIAVLSAMRFAYHMYRSRSRLLYLGGPAEKYVVRVCKCHNHKK